jgi:hypothetical protein
MADFNAGGTITGAAGGAQAGAMFGPWGMAGGAILGGVMGSGILGGQDAPSPPSLRDIYGRGSSYQYTGMNLKQASEYEKLKAMTSRTPSQQARFEHFAKLESQSPMNQQIAALKKYMPQYNDFILGLMDQYAPREIEQQAKYGGALAQANLDIKKQLYGDYYKLQSGEAARLQDTLAHPGLSPDQQRFATNQLAALSGRMGTYGSPLSQQNMMYQLTDLDSRERQLQDQQRQSFLNAYPMDPVMQVQQVGAMPGAGLAGGSLNAPNINDIWNTNSQLQGLNYAQAMSAPDTSWQGGLSSLMNNQGAGGLGSLMTTMNGFGTKPPPPPTPGTTMG